MTPKQLAALHAKCFSQPRPWDAQEFTGLLNSNAVFLCRAAYGFALGRVAGPEVELLTIAVDPDYRRQGLAHDLMRDFEQMAKENGARDAFLEVAENNIAAIGLYQRRGFTQTGLRKDYYASLKGPRISAIVMNKPL